jgi:hypothetical protein
MKSLKTAVASCLAFTFISGGSGETAVSISDSVANRAEFSGDIRDTLAANPVDRYACTGLMVVRIVIEASISYPVEVWQYCNSKHFASEGSGVQVVPGSAAFIERAKLAIC